MQQLDAILEKSDADVCKSWAAREGDSKGEPKHIQTVEARESKTK